MKNQILDVKIKGDLISRITIFYTSISRFEIIFLTKISFSIRSPFSNLLIREFSELENTKYKRLGGVGGDMYSILCISVV